MLKNNKKTLIIETLIVIISILLFEYVLEELLPLYKIGLGSILFILYSTFLFGYFTDREDILSGAKVLTYYLFAIIIIINIMALTSLFIILTNKYGLEVILEQSSVGKGIYFLICFLQPIILPLPEPAIIVTGSLVLGKVYGFILGVSGIVLGSVTMFYIARYGGEKIVSKIVKKKKLEAYQRFVTKNENIIIFGLFILPVLPDEVVCVGAGVGGVSAKKFISIASMSKIITAFMYTQSTNVDYMSLFKNNLPLVIIIGICLIILSITTFIIYRKRKKQKEQHLERG